MAPPGAGSYYAGTTLPVRHAQTKMLAYGANPNTNTNPNPNPNPNPDPNPNPNPNPSPNQASQR